MDDAPVWDDVGSFDGRPWRGAVDLVAGGFPCPSFSVAGKRRGADDARWLWPHFHRIIEEVQPRMVFLENVPGITTAPGERLRCVCGRSDRWGRISDDPTQRISGHAAVRPVPSGGNGHREVFSIPQRAGMAVRGKDHGQPNAEETGTARRDGLLAAAWNTSRVRPRYIAPVPADEAWPSRTGDCSVPAGVATTDDEEWEAQLEPHAVGGLAGRIPGTLESQQPGRPARKGICRACGRPLAGSRTRESIRGSAMGDVLWSLVVLGFDCEWDVFSAEETGAPHKRQRWFCLAVANTQRDRLRQFDGPRRAPRSVPEYAGPVVVHPNGAGREEHGGSAAVRPEQPSAERAGGVVGHAEGGARLGQAPGAGGHPAQPDQEPVADTAIITEREPLHAAHSGPDGGQARGVPLNGSDYPLADSEGAERERSGDTWQRGAGSPNGVYPPARNDHAGWAAVEASLEPAVCRDADGLDTGLDPALFAYRQDRLRAVGNGVVPLTAAFAWIELMARIQGEQQ
jgi:site-specific DNA-cytosine methylase